ncbi:MAG: hypothetical protein GY696_16675 [Gammaproteobacteria bacterium]|nr:hypothetical protein [Gammaproteobacteria bacterium]
MDSYPLLEIQQLVEKAGRYSICSALDVVAPIIHLSGIEIRAHDHLHQHAWAVPMGEDSPWPGHCALRMGFLAITGDSYWILLHSEMNSQKTAKVLEWTPELR